MDRARKYTLAQIAEAEGLSRRQVERILPEVKAEHQQRVARLEQNFEPTHAGREGGLEVLDHLMRLVETMSDLVKVEELPWRQEMTSEFRRQRFKRLHRELVAIIQLVPEPGEKSGR